MKIAFTADLHLTTQSEHPERYNALANILTQCGELKVDLLVIAGDLFDESAHNLGDFEAVIKKCRPRNLRVIVIPGNHDADLTREAFAVKDIDVISEPELLSPEGSEIQLLLIPYRADRTMGEEIAPYHVQLLLGDWVLVGHGDWAGGLQSPDPYEKGVYMPLARSDLDRFKPRQVFLGHIHMPYDEERIHYPGSPCPLNITETGLRRFLIFDTQTHQTDAQIVESDVLYFDEHFVLLPVEDEVEYLKCLIGDRIKGWGLPEGVKDRVRIRVRVSGYVSDRSRVEKAITSALKGYEFYQGAGPELSDLNLAVDTDRTFLIRQIKEWLEALEWPSEPGEPSKDDILIEAMRLIYGG